MSDGSLVDELLCEFDVSDTVGISVEASAETTWRALMEADLMEVGRRRHLAGALGAVRMLPEFAADLLHGERPPAPPHRMRLGEMGDLSRDEGGWILLGERPGRELALGLVGKFWRPVIDYRRLAPEEFTSFDEPGWARTVYSLAVEPLGEHRTLATGTMRTATNGERARRWFRRYWTLGVGSGAHILVNALLELVRESAEAVPAAEGDRAAGGRRA